MRESLYKKSHDRFNRNRPLEINVFQATDWEEHGILEIAKAIGEKDVRYLLSIKDRYGYKVIKDAWEEMRTAMQEKRAIRSHVRFLNFLIQSRLKGGEFNE